MVRSHRRAGSMSMDTSSSPGGWIPSNSAPSSHPFPASSGDLPPSMLSTPSPAMPSLGNVYPDHEPARQRRHSIVPGLMPSIRETMSRKRKLTNNALQLHIAEDDTLASGAHPQSYRRPGPRLRTRQNGPLFMSPGQEREEEERITTYQYPPNATDASHSIRRYFEPGHAREYNPRMLGSKPLPKVSSLESDYKERGRSDSASSCAHVALASVASPKHGPSRLSTLLDLGLPRPFEETGQPRGPLVVHQRGLEAGPFFPSSNGSRATGRSVLRGPGSSPRSAMSSSEPSMTRFLDGPICDSPESVCSNEGRRRHYEPPTIQMAQMDLNSPREPYRASHHSGRH